MTTQDEKGPVTFIQCGERCNHDFFGPGSSERGGNLFWERTCAKCGIGAMEADMWSDQP